MNKKARHAILKSLSSLSDSDFRQLMEDQKKQVFKNTQGQEEVNPSLAIAATEKDKTKTLILVNIRFNSTDQQSKEAVLMAIGAKCCASLKIPEAVFIASAAEHHKKMVMVVAAQTIDGRTAITTAPFSMENGKAILGDFEEITYNEALHGDISLLRLVYAGFFKALEAMHGAFTQQRSFDRINDEPSLN